MAEETRSGLAEFAASFGFECIGTVPASQLHPKPETRDMCAADRCHAYDKNWACPPGCGPLEDFEAAIASKDEALVVQTLAQLEDEFDFEGMEAAMELHIKRFVPFAEALRTKVDEHAPGTADDLLFLAAGGCTVCPECTYPDKPCRFPKKRFVSMEAAGLVVAEVCTAAGIPYYHGKGTLSYSSCVVYKDLPTLEAALAN